jgi:hypothetical protein
MGAARWGLGLILFSTVCVALAQRPADSNLVYVHVAVGTNDSSERAVTGIEKESFKVLEDNKEQAIAYFSAGSNPFSAGIVVDGSREWRDRVKTVLPPLLMNHGSPDDEFFLADSQELTNEVLYQTANVLLQKAHNPLRVLVLFTDRYDPGSYSYSKLRDLFKDKEFELYVVSAPPSPRTNEITTPDMTVLRDLAEFTGGKFFSLVSPNDVERLSSVVTAGWRHQYRIGYEPTNPAADGTWRKIKVTVDLRDPATSKDIKTNVRTKSGYYAPAAPATK